MFNVYTTFAPKAYNIYGKRFIETFLECWPKNIKLYIYYESKVEIENSRIIWLNYKEECKDQQEFFNRGLKIPQDSFYKGANYFSFKSFTIINHLKKKLDRFNIWLDADCITTKKISIDWLNNLKLDNTCLSVLMRNTRAIESGFILTDNLHSKYNLFIEKYSSMYIQDLVYSLPEWHDGYVLTHIIKNYNIPYFDLSPNNPYREIHPFATGILGEYLDHLKGPRKTSAGSSERQLIWN